MRRRASAEGTDPSREIVCKAADGTGSLEVLLPGDKIATPWAFSPDGRQLILGRWSDERPSS